ncbi:MAG: ABC transporter permease [Ilumatobacteraceae bacterium]
MSVVADTTTVMPELFARRRRHPLRGMRTFARREQVAAVAAVFLLLVILASLAAPLIAPFDPEEQNYDLLLATPSWTHPLGTDDLGRDVLSRLLWGGRSSMAAVALAVSVALAIGVPLGLADGFARGKVDAVIMRCVEAIQSFPGLVLAIGVTGALGTSLINSMFAVGLVFSPTVMRLVRSRVLSVREEPFVQAGVTFGASGKRLMWRYVLPNSIQPVLVQLPLLLAFALIAEASLSFLGLGIQPPAPSWGSSLGRAYASSARAPWQVIAPGVLIVLVALSFNLLGDGLSRNLDPRLRTANR